MNKEFFLNSLFSTVKAAHDEEGGDQESLTVEGYASTVSKDRHGDVILPDVWNKPGVLDNYRKNPIVLEQHDHDKPIGRVEQIEVDNLGLKVRAKIFNLKNSDMFSLVKNGVVKTFSIGFMLKDLDYSEEKDAWVIKDLELFEISAVSVPANQDSSFSLAKGMSIQDYAELKQRFCTKEDEMVDKTKNTGTDNGAPSINEDQIAEMVAKQAQRLVEKQKEEAAAEEARQKEFDEKVSKAVEAQLANIKPSEDVTDKLEKALEAKFKELQEGTASKAELNELMEQVKSSKAEFRAKGDFQRDRMSKQQVKEADIDTAVILAAHFKNTGTTETKFAKQLLEKSGMEHWETGTQVEWEEDFSTRVWEDLRRDLVIEDAITSINMTQQQMNMPVSPDARYAEWITQTNYRGANSTGTAADHELTDQSLKAHKMAAKEFLGYEEDEDSIIPLVPLIRNNLVRSMQKSSEKALLLGAGTTADPLSGLVTQAGAAGADVAAAAAGQISVSDLHQLRKGLGIWGLRQADVMYLVSMKAYYEIVEDPDLKTVEVAGDRATQFNGQIGMLHGSPVVVCSEFNDAALEAGTADTATAVAFNMRNFLLGNWRNLMIESDRDIQEQKQVMVATRRMAFNSIISGQGVATLYNSITP